jgi:glycosyltransferase involved in cell wall biosynthesis
MRILHVVPIPAVRYEGCLAPVHALCRALAARGNEVEVFTTSINEDENSSVPPGIPVTLDGVKIMAFVSPVLQWWSWAPSLVKSLRHEIKGADILHLHSGFLWPIWDAARLARRVRIPYVISPRGVLAENSVRRGNRLVDAIWLALIERSNLQGATLIHATSAREATEIQHFGWRLPPIAVVSDRIDEAETARRMESLYEQARSGFLKQ